LDARGGAQGLSASLSALEELMETPVQVEIALLYLPQQRSAGEFQALQGWRLCEPPLQLSESLRKTIRGTAQG